RPWLIDVVILARERPAAVPHPMTEFMPDREALPRGRRCLIDRDNRPVAFTNDVGRASPERRVLYRGAAVERDCLEVDLAGLGNAEVAQHVGAGPVELHF